MTIRPRRSVLYMPGSNARAIEKARSLPADGVIIDLEDAVAPDAKVAAREQVAAAVKQGGFGAREVFIRVNGIDTPWHAEDMMAAAQAAPDAILVPKINNSDQLEMVGQRLLDMGCNKKTRIWAMIETPFAILNILDIARAATDSETRLAGFVLGTNDLAKEMGARPGTLRAPFQGMLGMAVAAARAHGLVVLDGVFNAIDDDAGFAEQCAQAVEFGFDGKTLIHPRQIAACNAAFTPDADAVAWARAIVAAFADPANAAKGAIRVEGRMVERLHLAQAERDLAVAEWAAAG